MTIQFIGWAAAVSALCAACALAVAIWHVRLSRRDSDDALDMMIGLLQEEMKDQRAEALQRGAESSRDVRDALDSYGRRAAESFDRLSGLQARQMESLERHTTDQLLSVQQRLGEQETKLAEALARLESENSRRVDELRQAVSERLETTLSRRLGDSFAQVSGQLEAVQRGLGEMQGLAGDVGDLQRTLTGVKTRGTWGEVQLESLLSQILAPAQYERSVALDPDSAERVDFGLKIPTGDPDEPPLWLPLDAKFPLASYERLLAARERGDADGEAAGRRELIKALDLQAASVRKKYVRPPVTTDFALLFLPSESLYAEALRDPSTLPSLQERHRVVPVGPTTLAALLNSLRLGFRALAISRRSGEVWRILGDVKTEFARFGEVLERVRKQLGAAANSIEETGRRTRAMEQRLEGVERSDEPEGREPEGPAPSHKKAEALR